MGASRLGAWGRAVSPLLPAGSRPGMGEASDMNSGILLHSGEKGLWGRGGFWGAPVARGCSDGRAPPSQAEKGAHRCRGTCWGHMSCLEKALGK